MVDDDDDDKALLDVCQNAIKEDRKNSSSTYLVALLYHPCTANLKPSNSYLYIAISACLTCLCLYIIYSIIICLPMASAVWRIQNSFNHKMQI